MKSFEFKSSPEVPSQSSGSAQELREPRELTPERAMAQERGILERFGEKAKEVARVLLLATALATGAGAVEQSSAQEKPAAEDVEKKKSPQERAVDLLNTLSNLPDNPAAINEAHNNIMKSQVARQLIFRFALEKKLGFPDAGRISGRVTPDDIRSALGNLEAAGETLADTNFGDKDGKASPEEMEKFKQAVKSNPGLRSLQEMFQQFLSQ